MFAAPFNTENAIDFDSLIPNMNKACQLQKVSREVTNTRVDMPQGADEGLAAITVTCTMRFAEIDNHFRKDSYTYFSEIQRESYADDLNEAITYARAMAAFEFLAMDRKALPLLDGTADLPTPAPKNESLPSKEEKPAPSIPKLTPEVGGKRGRGRPKKEEEEAPAPAPAEMEVVAETVGELIEDSLVDNEAPSVEVMYDKKSKEHAMILGEVARLVDPDWKAKPEVIAMIKEVAREAHEKIICTRDGVKAPEFEKFAVDTLKKSLK